MEKRFLSVEAVADILMVHARTVRRYIKEKKLGAQKFGGQWRVSFDDLKKFTGIENIDELMNKKSIHPEEKKYDHKHSKKVLVSSIVDVNVKSKEEALRLSNTFLAAMKSPHKEKGARLDYLFYEDEGRARFVLWGSPNFIKNMMSLFEAIVE